MKIIDQVLDEKSDIELAFFWQMIGPFFVLCSFALAPADLLLFSVGILGLFLSARFSMKGFFYALLLLSVVAMSEHIFFAASHLWFLGLESSYAMAFLITALSADRHQYFVKTLMSQIETRGSSILNLEEEFTKSQAEGTKQQVLSQEKVDLLQKHIEELLSEHSSLVILNEVLRKTTARHILDSAAVQDALSDAQHRIECKQLESIELQGEVSRLKDESAIVQENRHLVDEINAARLDREQTHMINETLARLHAKENLRAQSAENEKLHLNGQINASRIRIEALEHEKQQLDAELNAARVKEALGGERRPSQVDLLYKQLKAQFEEKNETLHKTRKELFHTDTALQALKVEVERNALSVNAVPREILEELTSLEKEIAHLTQENEELQSLVSVLSHSDTAQRKKKVKVIPDQGYLF